MIIICFRETTCLKATNKCKISYMKSANHFLKGTMILAISMAVVKIIGSLNWIILARVLGGEGIGIYQMGFPIYLMAITISSAGIPVAISIITAEKLAHKDFRGAKRVFNVSLRLLAASGLFFSVLVFFSASWLIDSHFVRDARAYYSIVALSPAIFFVTFLASFRGYLQGWQIMTPTAVSEIVEQLVRVITMLIFADLLLPQGLALAAGGASMGAGAGAIAALCVLMWFYANLKKKFQKEIEAQDNSTPVESAGHIVKRLLTLALPVSLTSIMLPLGANLDLLIVPQRLEVAGLSLNSATEMFGYLTGMAVPLVNLAAIFTAAMTMSLVPSISESKALNDWDSLRHKVQIAMRVALIITCPCCIGLFALAEHVAEFIYAAPMAADAIRVMSCGIIFLGIHQISTGILQGLGHTGIPVINMLIACAVKVFLNWTLTADPVYGIKGAAFATVCDFAFAAILNMVWVYKLTKYSPSIMSFVKPMLAAVVMGAEIFFVLQNLKGTLALAVAFFSAVVVYAAVLFAIKGITKEDLEALPFIGRRLAKYL